MAGNKVVKLRQDLRLNNKTTVAGIEHIPYEEYVSVIRRGVAGNKTKKLKRVSHLKPGAAFQYQV